MANVSGSTRTLFVSPQDARDNTIINNNVSGKLLNVIIRTAEDKYIMPIIGGNLYYTIINKISTNTLTGDYKFLVDNFIIPCLLEYTVYEYIPYTYKFTNKGISKQTSDTSEPADLPDLYYIRDNVRDTAQFYGENLIQYLKVNANSFPEYSTWLADQIPPADGDNIVGGIHIPGSNRNDSWKGDCCN